MERRLLCSLVGLVAIVVGAACGSSTAKSDAAAPGGAGRGGNGGVAGSGGSGRGGNGGVAGSGGSGRGGNGGVAGSGGAGGSGGSGGAGGSGGNGGSGGEGGGSGGGGSAADCQRNVVGAQLAHDGGCPTDGAVADSHPDGAAATCAPPPSGFPDGGAHCASVCDPSRPDGGVCYGVPSYNPANISMELWVEDASAPGGGWRVALGSAAAVTVGGHGYQDRADGLVGTGGNGVFGDLFVARDGQAKWTGFHFEGFAGYQGNGVWDWNATLTVSRSGAASPMTIGRHYRITRSSSACNAAGTYTFVADDPPRACAFGVDLLSFALPST
jgi:hypothetical protein